MDNEWHLDNSENAYMEHRFSVFFKDQFDSVTPQSRNRHLKKHCKLLAYELLSICYILFLIGQYHYSFSTWQVSYIWARDFNFHFEDCLKFEYESKCGKVYDKIITNWMIVCSGYGGFVLLRRLTIIALWKYKADPH